MTIDDMHRAFEVRIGTLNDFKVFTSSEIDYYLNAAQRALYEEIVPLYEKDDKVKTTLYKLLKSYTWSSLFGASYSAGFPVYNIAMPSNFRQSEGERATITYNGSTYYPRVKSVSQKYYNLNKDNKFKQPSKDLVWRFDDPDKTSVKYHELVLGISCSLTSYEVRYLADISDMNIFTGTDSLLHEMVHENIVEKAIALAINDVIARTKKQEDNNNNEKKSR